jgi:hypothetical protein
VITVLQADMRSLFAAAHSVYSARTEEKPDPKLGRYYLEKLVQLQLELPPPRANDMSRLLKGRPAREGEGSNDERRGGGPGLEEVQSWALYLTSFGATFSVASLAAARVGGTHLGIVAAISGAVAVVGAVVGTATGIWRSRQREKRREIAEQLKAELARGAEEKSTADVVRDAGIEQPWQEFAGQFVEGVQTVRSPEVEAVERFIQRYPPRFPRAAKRMLNHARLLTAIAREREMFGGSPELTPEHLGKWIVLGERWPEVAERVAATSLRFGTEEALRLESLRALQGGDGNRDLERLLDDQPELHGLVRRLVYFEPAQQITEPPGSVETDSVLREPA